ncbi:LysR family transcriptional regulator [Robbsia andropogonis]|uniref:LysR family transcriptional regulator n=2 Tax=Robbsia andropogonis TaxID=28092 RepID=A0A0F5K1R0_9BURK|nr:LysR family transcriptional regulator [Robbsia andropogonis]KKB63497.1 LysR family transcriptional regulator [Robbsia andropogonis]MCP1116886.1 LysR family transcriptional regulator [Robbsia andropogonis]
MRALLEPSLYYFSVVAQCGSLTASTEKLGMTVSALSRHIAKLEGDLGVPLFERHARGMKLSHAGEMLYRHARRSIADAEALEQDIRRDTAQQERRIRIACTEGFAFDFLPNSLSRFRNAYPECSVLMDVVPSHVATQKLLSGEAQIALTFSMKPEPGIRVRWTMSAPVMALMRTRHPLATRRSVRIADLLPYPILVQQRVTTNQQLFDIACNVEGVDIVPAVTSQYAAALYQFVKTMDGAVMPSGYVSVANRMAQDDLIAIRFDNPLLQQRRLQVQTLAGRTLSGMASACLEWLISDLRQADVVGDGEASIT